MKPKFYSIAVYCFFLSLLSLQTMAQGFSPEIRAKLQQVIEDFQVAGGSPGIGGISAAINVDGLGTWEGATGFASRNIDAQNNLLPGGTSFRTDTLSRIYSITKTFTAALALELASEGSLTLEDPISKFLPLIGVVNPGLNTNVTLRQLLAHESGYSDYTTEMNLQVAVAFDPARTWTPYEMASFVHQLVPPGTQRRYSSTNYILLGAAIEAATGKRIEQLFRERFFEPLRLNSMFFGGRESIGSRGSLASPHDNISPFNPIFQLTGQPVFPDAYTNISRFPLGAIVSLAFTSGAIVSDAADVAKWGNALFGARATKESTVNTMLNSISPNADEDGDKLGYGIFSNTKISATDYFVGHDGNAPGYRSLMFYQPERKMTIVVLTNFHGGDPYAVAKALYEALPNFLCGNGNRKEDKIIVCFNGKSICVSRSAAPALLKKGAYLGCSSISLTQNANSIADETQALKDELRVFPNPARNDINFSFTSGKSGPVNVMIYDLQGKLTKSLFVGNLSAGANKTFVWYAGNLPAGMYFARVHTSAGTIEKKIVISK